MQIQILNKGQALNPNMAAGGVFLPVSGPSTMGTTALPKTPPLIPLLAHRAPALPQPRHRYPKVPAAVQSNAQHTYRPACSHSDNDRVMMPHLHAVRALQNEMDGELDLADLRFLLRRPLQAGLDTQMTWVLQRGRDEMSHSMTGCR